MGLMEGELDERRDFSLSEVNYFQQRFNFGKLILEASNKPKIILVN